MNFIDYWKNQQGVARPNTQMGTGVDTKVPMPSAASVPLTPAMSGQENVSTNPMAGMSGQQVDPYFSAEIMNSLTPEDKQQIGQMTGIALKRLYGSN